MEIKTKEMKQATYKVEAESDGYNVQANVTIGTDNAVTNIESGSVTKDGAYIANFSMFGVNLSVNYTSEITLEVQQQILNIINELKTFKN